MTTNGPLSADPYFIRIAPTGDPNVAASINLGNGGATLDQRSVIDAGFLELVRLGELSANDADVQNSLKVVDATIMKQTPSGPGWLRYNGDGYGDCSAPSLPDGCTTLGAPWAPSDSKTGLCLAGAVSRAWRAGNGHRQPGVRRPTTRVDRQRVVRGRTRARTSLGHGRSRGLGLRQIRRPPPSASSTANRPGRPLRWTWGSASQVRLVADLSARKVLEQPKQTVDRYVKHTRAALH